MRTERLIDLNKIGERTLNKNILDILPGGSAAVRTADRKLLMVDDGLLKLTGYTREDFNSMDGAQWYLSLLHPEDAARFQQEATKQLLTNGRLELECRLIKKDGTLVWVKIYSGFMRNEEWGLFMQCVLLDNTASHHSLEEAERTRLEIETLTNTIPGGVAQVAINDKFQILLASDGFYRMTGYTRDEYHAAPIFGNGIALVIEQDIPAVTATIQEQLTAGVSLYVEYRMKKKNGDIIWIAAYGSGISEKNGTLIVEAVFIDTTAAKEAEHRLVNLTNNIPGGVAHLHIENNELIIDYASDGFYRLAGYTAEEYMRESINGRYSYIIYPEDRPMVYEKALSFVTADKVCASLDYRIIMKNGTIRWNRVNAARITDIKNVFSLECIFTDVTDSRNLQKQLELTEERYRIISEQTQEIVFDWDMQTDSIYYSPVFEQKFGYQVPNTDSIDFLLNSGCVFEEDKSNLMEIFNIMRAGQPYAEAEYRIKKSTGEFVWCKIRATVIFDDTGKPYRGVGIITDIDTYKKETALLQEKVEEDQLTGLLNKITTEKRIKACLARAPEGQRHALYIIDIDNFKQVNDTLGHLMGDIVLTEISSRIHQQFRDTDIVGRIGGDEFAVLIENVPSDEVIMQKADILRTIFRHSIRGPKEKHCISGSIGIAVFPDHGTNFQELYEKADKALYRSKHKGKDCFCIY